MHDNLQRKRASLKWSHKEPKTWICKTRLWDKFCVSKCNHLHIVCICLIRLCCFSHWCSCVFQVRHHNKIRIGFLSGLPAIYCLQGAPAPWPLFCQTFWSTLQSFLNKDISASNGFGLISLSRSNNVGFIFAAVAYRFHDSCWTGELQVLPLLSSQLASVGLFLNSIDIYILLYILVYTLVCGRTCQNVPVAYFIQISPLLYSFCLSVWALTSVNSEDKLASEQCFSPRCFGLWCSVSLNTENLTTSSKGSKCGTL